MDIRVSGHQLETGEALRTHVETRLGAVADKYFSKALSAQATFGRAPHDKFSCDIIVHVMQGLILKGGAAAADARTAFDGASEKIEKQLRRYMRRLQDRHSQAAHAAKQEEAAYTVFDAGDAEAEAPPPEAPVIVAEMSVDIPESSVSDAVMLMDLRNTPALLFKNAGTGRHNMVYRRADGTIGWVEPRSAS
ncbi:ribosome hibernation-promoting factor, HPF/YfiA family [Sphingorhabdus sp.]|jgi:ribosomal subunit interface protein|uniref:ribosome hibernation-promoting factor, HPF/YfiA family n=1 Tax=Sphingorhabdus sp. TaxID=1902408 RepID=UPI0035B4E4DF|nr:ribosome-associated translation inhibitor RaiA [Sphingomonadaceae bacterium]